MDSIERLHRTIDKLEHERDEAVRCLAWNFDRYWRKAWEATAVDLLVKNKELEFQTSVLVRNVSQQAQCTGCGKPVYWVKLNSGKYEPFNIDGSNHFATCPTRPYAKEFRKKQ